MSQILHLADHGQDFTRLTVDVLESGHAVITDAAPFQAWLWRGKLIHKDSLAVGAYPDLFDPEADMVMGPLHYPITKIEEGRA
jgi:hypothetical protein